MNIIKGPKHPKAEEKTNYQISSSVVLNTNPFSLPTNEKFTWRLYKNVAGKWKKIEGNIKYGRNVPYTFGEKVVGVTFKIEVYREGKDIFGRSENKFFAILLVTPRTYKEPVIGRVILLNRGKTNVNEASFTETLTAEARTSNMFGKEITFNLWEEGASEAEKSKKPKTAKVDKNGIASVQFSLMEYASQPTMMNFFSSSKSSKKFYVTASYGMKEVTNKGAVTASESVSKETQTRKPPETTVYTLIEKTADVIAEGVGAVADYFTEKAKTATSVGKIDVKKKEEEKCQNCAKEITIDEVNKVLGDTEDQSYRKNIVLLLNKFISLRKGTKQELHINTCLRKAHYLSEIATETSLLEKKLTEGNTPPYYSENNIKNIWPARYKELVNSGKLSKVAAERPQKQLLNFVYGKKNGNKGGDDGWNYRGKGLIQLTGRTNYNDASIFLKKVFPDEYVDLEENYDKVAEIKYAVLSSIAFWEGKSIYNIADISKTKETVPNVRFLINSYDKDNPHTKKYFENAVEAFKVAECKKDKVEIKKSNSKVVLDFVGKTAKESALSEKTKNVLREVGEASGNYYIAITSTARTPYDQARIMYDNCKSNLKEQRNTYKAPGQRVIDVYENNRSKSRDSVIKLMEQKINELGPSNVSKHLANPEILNTFDIAYGNLKDKNKFLSEMKKRAELDEILIENNCYHTQINQK